MFTRLRNWLASEDSRLVLLGTLIILVPALRNGFPFTYVDTHAYIHSGMTISVPFDRPIFYGLWLSLTSLHMSLWIPVILQAFITSFLLLRTFQMFLPTSKIATCFVFGIAVLTLFTGMAINATMLLPDAFTPVLVLSVLLHSFEAKNLRLYKALMLISAVMHNSHWLILITLSLLGALYWRKQRLQLKKLFPMFVVSIVAVLMLSGTNWLKFRQFTPSVATHFFMMGRLSETGLLGDYLNQRCEQDSSYFMCGIKDQFPLGASEFIWSETGPLYYQGGYWQNEKAYKEAVKEIFSSPKAALKFLYRSGLDGLHQLFLNRILLERHDTSGNTQSQVAKHFPTDATAALQSMQVYENGLMYWMHLGYQVLLMLSLLILCLAWYRNMLGVEVKVLLIAVFLNAFVTATFANVDSRLQARLAWLVVIAAFWTFQTRSLIKSS